jgi:hypothetical protein
MYYCITPCLYGADSTISMPPTITAVHGSIGLYPGRSNRSTWVPIERCKFSRMKRGIAVMSPNRIQKLQQLGFELSWYESKCMLKTRLTNTAAPANSEMGATVGNRPRDGRSHQVRTYVYCRSVILIVVLQTLSIAVQEESSHVSQHAVHIVHDLYYVVLIVVFIMRLTHYLQLHHTN